MSYADRARPPRCLTQAETRRLLAVSGKQAEDFGSHVLFSLALGTGLREMEIAALNNGDVYNVRLVGHDRRLWTASARTRIKLRRFKGDAAGEKVPQEVMVSDALRAKLERFWKWRRVRNQSLLETSPLFSVALGAPVRLGRRQQADYFRDDGSIRRLSPRRMRERFARFAELAELSPGLTFHSLRHTFCQQLYETTRDVRLVQRAARHANLSTTSIYASASADDVLEAVNRCDS